MAKIKNIWESLNFGETENSTYNIVNEKLKKLGDDLWVKTEGLLNADITQTRDFINFCFVFTVRSEELGNFGRKIFTVSYSLDDDEYSIWDLNDKPEIFKNIEELDEQIENILLAEENKLKIQDLYGMSKTMKDERNI